MTERREKEEIVFFAEINYDDNQKMVGIKTNDRRQHMYLIGQAGVGKSTTIKNMVCQDIRAGHGVAVIDPYGGLAKKVMDSIPSSRVNDTVYLNLTDTKNPFSFNILDGVGTSYGHFLVVSNLLAVFKKMWAELRNPRIEYVLRNTILALLEYPTSTLLGIKKILFDKDYREKIIGRLADPIVKSFWENEYSRYLKHLQTEVIAPIQEKLGSFFSIPLIRNIVGQVSSKVDIDEIISKGKILIVNLSKTIVGERVSTFLGAMLVTKIQAAIVNQLGMSGDQRRDFYLYIDEFPDFVTDSFADILSKENKSHLNLIISHQYLGQLTSVDQNLKVKDAIFNNIGTILAYRVNNEDAFFLSKKVTRPRFNKNKLVNLDKRKFYIKVMVDGVISKPLFANVSEPSLKLEGNRDKIIKISQERYTEPQRLVEEKIARWLGIIKEGGDLPWSSGIGKYESKCDKCGIKVYVPFIPDGVRPIYCRQCLSLVKGRIEGKEEAEKTKGIFLDEAIKENQPHLENELK